MDHASHRRILDDDLNARPAADVPRALCGVPCRETDRRPGPFHLRDHRVVDLLLNLGADGRGFLGDKDKMKKMIAEFAAGFASTN